MNKHYHFIGIGGIGMGALASLLLDQGAHVSGSDLKINQVTLYLEDRGADICIGHYPENVIGADYVVFSSAVREDNPELAEARSRAIPVLRRAKLLAQLMENRTGITVAGAHGKTTTSSMIAHLLESAGLEPTTAIGGIISGTRSHGRIGKGEHFVTEVDESDGSFLYFAPKYSVITNVDFEHVDYYQSWQKILEAYRQFIDNTVDDGIVIANGDDGRLRALLLASQKSCRTYGFSAANNIYATDVVFNRFESKFRCVLEGEELGEVTLKVPGRHNVANALACISVGLMLNIDWTIICASLKEYEGVQRRFQLKGLVDEVWVIDDYAHHPTEIKATLETAQMYKKSVQGEVPGKDEGRLITVFQPHRYTRTERLFDEFADCLTLSDHLIITDIYAASEQPIAGVSAEHLCQRVCELTCKPVFYLPKEQIIPYLLTIVKPRDIILTLGAGDITQISAEFTEALKNMTAAALEKV